MNARLACAVALAGLGITAPMAASAIPYHVVYDATITDGTDVDNLFGLAGKSLVGRGMRADITYVTSVFGTRHTDDFSDEVSGGDAFGTDPVISSAVFTIGTASFTLSPSFYGDVYTSADYLDAYGYDTLGNNFQTYILPNRAAPASLEQPFSGTGIGDTGGRTTQYSYLIAGNDIIDFGAFRVTASAVPEAETWAMMIAGFGMMGCAMRRRDRGRTAAIA